MAKRKIFKVGDIVVLRNSCKGAPKGAKLRVTSLNGSCFWAMDERDRYEIFYSKREVKNITGKLSRALYGK